MTPKFPTLGFTKLLRETALGATVRSEEATTRPTLPSTGVTTLEVRPGGPWQVNSGKQQVKCKFQIFIYSS